MEGYNTIILYKGEAGLTPREYKEFSKGDCVFYADYRKELKRWPIEQEEEAQQELKKYSCKYERGPELYWIEEYGLEYCNTDEDGEFVDGSDFYIAKEA